MATFKCKMCGGTLNILPNSTVTECDSCGLKQTLPRLEDDRRANFYDRANHYRRSNDYDKALSIYEQILTEDNTDAEAYWSIVLCRYGIEYVKDPVTGKNVPTINRTQATSILADPDYLSALQYADGYQRDVYVEQATEIHEIQKGILAISRQEAPFDVFICYKESDSSGQRTPDSVLAQELYYELTEAGYRVFFARITLEDKLGCAYEPYIFAALQSAKVMVVLGTKSEYFEAVWVKNEWSRYLSLIQSGERKILIPAYRDMDPYDLPCEFSHLQAQDMSKLGFMQDLIRGIGKLVPQSTSAPTSNSNAMGTATASPLSSSAMIANYLKRISIFLADGAFDDANEYCDKVLDLDPENADAYLYALLADPNVRCKSIADLSALQFDFTAMPQYQRAYLVSDNKRKAELDAAAAPMLDLMRQQHAKAEESEHRRQVEERLRRRHTDLSRLIQDKKAAVGDAQQALHALQTSFAKSHTQVRKLNETQRKYVSIAVINLIASFFMLVSIILLIVNAIGFGLLLLLVGVVGTMLTYMSLAHYQWYSKDLGVQILLYALTWNCVGIYLSVITLQGKDPYRHKTARQTNASIVKEFPARKAAMEESIRALKEEIERLQHAKNRLPASVMAMPMPDVNQVEQSLIFDEKDSRYNLILLSCQNRNMMAQLLGEITGVSPDNAIKWLTKFPVCPIKNLSSHQAEQLQNRLGAYAQISIQLASI